MKICHVITRLIIGGAQENTVLTCRGLVERGHDVTLIAGPETGPEGSLWNEAKQSGCNLITVDSLRRSVHPFRDWRAYRELRKLYTQIQPDIVHTHSSKAGILGRSAAVDAGVHSIIHTIHGMSFNRTQSVLTRNFYRILETHTAHNTSSIITVADAMIEQAVEAAMAPRDRFTTIRSGMDTDLFKPDAILRAHYRKEWGISNHEIVVGTIARLFDHKGYEDIIDAMALAVSRESNLKFVWIGDGTNRERYEDRLKTLGLRDRVHLAGLMPPDQVASMLTGMDMIVHASRWEGLPRAVVQGLLMELPAISYDNDGAPEVVIPDETGILVQLGNVQGLADGMISLAEDHHRRHRLGQAGRCRCLEMFDWHRMVEDIEQLYHRVVAG